MAKHGNHTYRYRRGLIAFLANLFSIPAEEEIEQTTENIKTVIKAFFILELLGTQQRRFSLTGSRI
jgi:hypothetical protein